MILRSEPHKCSTPSSSTHAKGDLCSNLLAALTLMLPAKQLNARGPRLLRHLELQRSRCSTICQASLLQDIQELVLIVVGHLWDLMLEVL